MLRAFPDLIEGIGIQPVSNYGHQLRDAMAEIAPATIDDPQIVLLSHGVYNSAHFEHVFLAREIGVPLVEGADLIVEGDQVLMKTTAGRKRVDVIYRRINDDFLDPEMFEPTSLLGVPGLMRAYRKGKVGLANAVGTGVADDKAVYAYMPRIIRYYLDQDPIILNVETRICREPEALRYTLDHLSELVVKPVGESGGYGITIGPKASADEQAFFKKHKEATATAVVHFYTMDRDNPNSIIQSIRAAWENARGLRHVISIELWTQLNVFYRWLQELKRRDYAVGNLSTLCARIKEQCQLHTGIVEGTMFRDQGLVFYSIGKQMERADQLTRLVDIKYHRLLPQISDVGSAIDVSQWNALLRSAAAYQTYRRIHPSGMTPRMVAGFLLFNPGFARSITTCVSVIRTLVDRLKADPSLEGVVPGAEALMVRRTS